MLDTLFPISRPPSSSSISCASRGAGLLARLLPVMWILSPPLHAVELENKEGKKLDGEIIAADPDRVKILIPDSGREHILKRANLAPHSNGKIDDFLTMRRQRGNLTTGERVHLDLEDINEGRKKKRVSLLLPQPGIESRPFGAVMEFSGGEPLNNLRIQFWGSRPPVPLLDEMCETDLEGQMSVILENSKALSAAGQAELRSLLKIESMQLGPWKVWMLSGWDPADLKRFPALRPAPLDALIYDPDHLLRLKMSVAPAGIFKPWMLPLIIESIKVEPSK